MIDAAQKLTNKGLRMILAQAPNPAIYQISRMEKNCVWVGEKAFINSFILWPNKIYEHWRPASYDELLINDFKPLLESPPTLLLLSTGEKSKLPNSDMIVYLMQHGIPVEIMSTAAACSTYTVLCSEGRNVAVAIFLR